MSSVWVTASIRKWREMEKIIFWNFQNFGLSFWTIWTEKLKKNSGNHLRMSWNGEKCKKNCWKFSKFWLSFWTIWTEKQKFFFWKSSQNVMKWREMQKKIFGNLTAYQLLRAVKLSQKNFDFRNWFRNSKPNCMPKISLIDWVWNSALFWQLISCFELSSCQKKI